MPLNTINLSSISDKAAISIITGIHLVDPIGSFKEAPSGDLYIAYAKTDDLIDLLAEIEQARQIAETKSDPWDWDIVWHYVQERLFANLPEFKDYIIGRS